jgi:hypothetical protein
MNTLTHKLVRMRSATRAENNDANRGPTPSVIVFIMLAPIALHTSTCSLTIHRHTYICICAYESNVSMH